MYSRLSIAPSWMTPGGSGMSCAQSASSYSRLEALVVGYILDLKSQCDHHSIIVLSQVVCIFSSAKVVAVQIGF